MQLAWPGGWVLAAVEKTISVPALAKAFHVA
jgi:hypothetical protein